jgi:tRNA G18 (ribose-2'-O)-methylase SpoU
MVRKVTLLRPLKSQLKLWEKLGQVKYRHQEGLFLAEGFKVVQELLQSDWVSRAILVKKRHTGMIFYVPFPKE